MFAELRSLLEEMEPCADAAGYVELGFGNDLDAGAISKNYIEDDFSQVLLIHRATHSI